MGRERESRGISAAPGLQVRSRMNGSFGNKRGTEGSVGLGGGGTESDSGTAAKMQG